MNILDEVTLIPLDPDILWQRQGHTEYANVAIPTPEMEPGKYYQITLRQYHRGRRRRMVVVTCADENGVVICWKQTTKGAAKRCIETYLRQQFHEQAAQFGLSPEEYCRVIHSSASTHADTPEVNC